MARLRARIPDPGLVLHQRMGVFEIIEFAVLHFVRPGLHQSWGEAKQSPESASSRELRLPTRIRVEGRIARKIVSVLI